ncbi:hypothetical protein [Azotobacter vinelandii]|uniref:hypothetical protein n=1 Tax=Azotobacter vinelandii TaxID=354 RepID=UPI0007736CF9|nr:hypothetical protein [Azotobacter vinelandii]
MGWLFYAATQQDLVDDRLRSDLAHPRLRRRTLASELVNEGGSWVLWYVAEYTALADDLSWLERGQSVRLINCDLIECRNGRWGYKDLGEACHPYYYSCPLAFLDLAPVVKSQAWRRGVREYHAARQ